VFHSVEEISYEVGLVTTTVRRVYMVKPNCVITLFRLRREDYRFLYNVKNCTQLQNVDFIYRKSL
jgi:hypothetical protein